MDFKTRTNVETLVESAKRLGFKLQPSRSMSEIVYTLPTTSGLFTLTIHWEMPHAQLDWQSVPRGQNFSIIPFDICEEEGSECPSVFLFETVLRNSLEVHKQELVNADTVPLGELHI